MFFRSRIYFISTVVRQSYEPRVTDEDVLRGNSAIVKCTIPSFVADYVHVMDWVTDEDNSLSTFSFNGSEGNYGNREQRAAPIVPIRTPLIPPSDTINILA